MLDNQRAIITIGNFEDAASAYDFYTAIENDEYVLSGINTNDLELFAISTNNYPILYREKNVKEYVDFFHEHYKESSYQQSTCNNLFLHL